MRKSPNGRRPTSAGSGGGSGASLDTAQQLVERRGYDGFSIADLVSASGVSNGSVYHHFGTKDGVLGALLLGAVEDIQNAILAVLD